MAINLLRSQYNPSDGPDMGILNQYLDKRRGNIRWRSMRRAMRVISDKLDVSGLRSPHCDEAVTQVMDNFPDLRHLIHNVEARHRIGTQMIRNRVERIRAKVIREEKGGPRRYKRKIGDAERIRWEGMRKNPRPISVLDSPTSSGLRRSPRKVSNSPVSRRTGDEDDESTSHTITRSFEVLYGDSPVRTALRRSPRRSPRQLPPTPVSLERPPHPPTELSSVTSAVSTPTRVTTGRRKPHAPITYSPRSPTTSSSSPVSTPKNDRRHTLSGPTTPVSPTSPFASTPDLQTASTKGWKGWIAVSDDTTIVPSKKFTPKDGKRKRKPNRRLIDL